MPDWGELLGEFEEERKKGVQNFYDTVRRRHLNKLFEYTKRNTIAYYSGFLSKPGIQLLSVNDEDMTGFMTTVHGVDKSKGLICSCTLLAAALRPLNAWLTTFIRSLAMTSVSLFHKSRCQPEP